MKNLFKNYGRSIIALLLVIALSAVLCACDGSTGSSISATDLTFDFTTGEYSFKGVEGAAQYRIRIFPVDAEGVESELPINESQDIRGGKESYTGTIDTWSLTAGSAYNVYVMTIDENGNSAMSEPQYGVITGTFAKISGGVTATIDGNTITVTLGSNALSNAYASGANYEISLLSGGNVVETKTLENSTIVATTDGDGSSATTTYENAFVTFEVADPAGEYTVTVKAASVSELFVSSEVSDPFTVTEASDVPAGGDTGNGGTDATTGGTENSDSGEGESTPAGSEPVGSEPVGSEPQGTDPSGTESAGGENSEGAES